MKDQSYGEVRRALVLAAVSSLYDAMIAFAEGHDTLTGWEWMKVFGEVQKDFYNTELAREWAKGAKDDPR